MSSIYYFSLRIPSLHHFHGAQCKVWAALLRRYIIEFLLRSSYQPQRLLLGKWRGSSKASLKTTALFRNLHVYTMKDSGTQFCSHWRMLVLRLYPHSVLLSPEWIRVWAQGWLSLDSWTASSPPLFHKPCILAQGFLHLEVEAYLLNFHKGTQQ